MELTFVKKLASFLIVLGACPVAHAAEKHPKPPKSLRLYIFDCGVIHTTNVDT